MHNLTTLLQLSLRLYIKDDHILKRKIIHVWILLATTINFCIFILSTTSITLLLHFFISDVEPPEFKCPENITVETIAEESYALVHLSLPDGTDNSGLDPIIWSKPPFLPEYPLLLKIGTTKIEVYGTDASDNGDFCEFYVQVQGNYE